MTAARPQSLPGMEDREIAELQEAALGYAETRDKRMRLNGEEVELKADLLRLMKEHGKETYLYNGVEIKIVREDETVKVKVHKDEDGHVQGTRTSFEPSTFKDGKAAAAGDTEGEVADDYYSLKPSKTKKAKAPVRKAANKRKK